MPHIFGTTSSHSFASSELYSSLHRSSTLYQFCAAKFINIIYLVPPTTITSTPDTRLQFYGSAMEREIDDEKDEEVYDTHLTMLGRVFVSAVRKFRRPGPVTGLHVKLVEELLSTFEHEAFKVYRGETTTFYEDLKKVVDAERQYMSSVKIISPAVQCCHGNAFHHCDQCKADSDMFSLYCKSHTQGIKLPSEYHGSDVYNWVMKIPASISIVPDCPVSETGTLENANVKRETAMVSYTNPNETPHETAASNKTSDKCALSPFDENANAEDRSELDTIMSDMSEWVKERPNLYIPTGNTAGKCYACNYFGHIERFCPRKHGKEYIIQHCDQSARRARKIAQEVPQIKPPNTSDRCKRCGRVADHKPRDCWTEEGKPTQCFWCFKFDVTLKTCPNCRDRYVKLGGKYGAQTRDPAARAQFVRVPGVNSPFAKVIDSQRE